MKQMKHLDEVTGQSLDYRDNNDNAPPRYSAPSPGFKAVLAGYANPYCSRCSGTGYIGRFKHVDAGRCFKCIPDATWERVMSDVDLAGDESAARDDLKELYLGVGSGYSGGPAYLCDGLWIGPDESRAAVVVSVGCEWRAS